MQKALLVLGLLALPFAAWAQPQPESGSSVHLDYNGQPVSASNPLPITGGSGGSSNTPSTYTSDFGPISVGTTTPVTIRAAGTHTLIFQVRGPAGSNLWLNLSGGTPVVGAGTFVPVGGQFQAPNGVTAAITGISDAGTLSVSGSAGTSVSDATPPSTHTYLAAANGSVLATPNGTEIITQ